MREFEPGTRVVIRRCRRREEDCTGSCVGYHGSVTYVGENPFVSVTWDWAHQLTRKDRHGCNYPGEDLNFERSPGSENVKGTPGSQFENF